jgi:hypothetical protein
MGRGRPAQQAFDSGPVILRLTTDCIWMRGRGVVRQNVETSSDAPGGNETDTAESVGWNRKEANGS